jgi:hypothetical protein
MCKIWNNIFNKKKAEIPPIQKIENKRNLKLGVTQNDLVPPVELPERPEAGQNK